MTKFRQAVRFVLDEGFAPRLAAALAKMGFRADRVEEGTKDPTTIRKLGEQEGPGIWVTRDLRSAVQHGRLIEETGVSVAWIKCGNVPTVTHAFLVFNFLYRYQQDVVEESPLYFVVTQESRGGRPNALVRRVGWPVDFNAQHER